TGVQTCALPISRAWRSTRACSAATSRSPPLPNQSRYCSQASSTSSSTSTIRRPRIGVAGSALQRHEGIPARVLRVAAQRFLDAQELVVLGDAVAAAQRAGLDLGRGGRHGDVGDGGVAGLAGAVRD